MAMRLISKLWALPTAMPAIGRWKHIGITCEERMAKCASLVWSDYNSESNEIFVPVKKNKTEQIPKKKCRFNNLTADEITMIASVYY